MTFAWHLLWLRPHLSGAVNTSADQYTLHVTYTTDAWSATQAIRCKIGALDVQNFAALNAAVVVMHDREVLTLS